MKIAIHVDENIKDTEISISCSQMTPQIEKILAALRILDRKNISFFPMLSMFNEGIEKIVRITYSQQINLLINQIENAEVSVESISVIILNMVAAILLFGCAYRRSGLE